MADLPLPYGARSWQDLRAFLPQQPDGTAFLQSLMRAPTSGVAAMPQTMTEAEDLRQQGRAMVPAYFGAVPALAAGPVFGAGEAALSGALRTAGNMAARYPMATMPAAAGAGLMAAPTQAEPPSPLQVARDTIAQLRQAQTALQTERGRLTAEGRQFDAVNSSDKAAVAEAQRRLGLNPDGNWGPLTARAIAQHKAGIQGQLGALDQQATRLARDLETQQQRLTGLEGGERLRLAQEEVGPVRRVLREAGPWIGLGLGGGLGWLTRRGAVRHAAEESAARATAADALMAPPRPRQAQDRAARLNEFWRSGGAGERVPYAPAQTPRGVKPRPGAASGSELYPPGREWWRGSDIGVAGAFGGEAAISGGLMYMARQELTEAERAAASDPSQVNIDRLTRAQDAYTAAETMMRFGLGGAAGRLGTAPKMPYRDVRPDVGVAEAEVMRLNQLLARKRK